MRKKKCKFFPLFSPTSLILGTMTVVAWGPLKLHALVDILIVSSKNNGTEKKSWKGYVNFTYLILEVASLREVESLTLLQILIYCWNVIKSMGGCLKAKNVLNIVMTTVEFSPDNNELKFAGLSRNQLWLMQVL